MTFCHTAILKLVTTMSIQAYEFAIVNETIYVHEFPMVHFCYKSAQQSDIHTHSIHWHMFVSIIKLHKLFTLVHSPDLNKHNYLHALQLNSKAIIDIHDNGSNATVIIACTELVLHYDIIKSLCVL